MNKKVKDTLFGGITQNPIFVLVLGMCAILAGVTKTLSSAIGMGLAVTFVLVMCNTIISLLRNIIPDSVRLPCYIVIIATMVTLVQMLLKAYIPDLYNSLGVFLPLITVNCIILARAEGFAKNNKVGIAALDGLSMGIGYLLAVCLMAIIRETLSTGKLTIWGTTTIKFWDGAKFGINFFSSAGGAFLTLACLMAAYTTIVQAVKNKKSKPAAQEAANAEVTE